MKRILVPAVIAISAFLFDACKKEETVDTETTSATDNSICENEFMRLLPTVNKIAIDEPGVHRLVQGSTYILTTCPLITVDTNQSFPKNMYIDYGSGCTDPVDGKVRKGRIICNLSESWDSVGAVVTISFDTLIVNNVLFEGTTRFTRTANNGFTQEVMNGRCSKGGTTPWEILYACTRNVTITSGNTSSTDPQIITITGTNSGTDRNGQSWTSTITSPLIRDLGCTWIIQGTFELTPQGKPVRVIDFGSGTCDPTGTITIEGNTFEFTMQ
jgi:hypothetical protein